MAETLQEAGTGQQDQQQQQLVAVSIGGQPPVSGPLLAAVRVMLAEVGAEAAGFGES